MSKLEYEGLPLPSTLSDIVNLVQNPSCFFNFKDKGTTQMSYQHIKKFTKCKIRRYKRYHILHKSYKNESYIIVILCAQQLANELLAMATGNSDHGNSRVDECY